MRRCVAALHPDGNIRCLRKFRVLRLLLFRIRYSPFALLAAVENETLEKFSVFGMQINPCHGIRELHEHHAPPIPIRIRLFGKQSK